MTKEPACWGSSQGRFFNDNIILFLSGQVKVNHIKSCFDFSNKKFYFLMPISQLSVTNQFWTDNRH